MKRNTSEITDEWLVLRTHSGDAEALRLLVERWQGRFLAHAPRLTGRHDAAADVVQETWLAIVRGIHRLDDPAFFRAWAYRIVTHKCGDWIRHRQRERTRWA